MAKQVDFSPAPLIGDPVKFWVSRYTNKAIDWHIEDVNPHLKSYLSIFQKEKKDPQKIFIPLCGKTKDIPYLLSLGFEVFGVEGVAQAVEQLDAENNLGLKFDPVDSVYGTEDGKLKVFCGDLFKCPIEKWGPFDCVWDRGSFIAIDYSYRELYSELLKRSVVQTGDH